MRVIGATVATVTAVVGSVLMSTAVDAATESDPGAARAPEVVSRTANSITTDNGDGTHTTEIHAGPVHYQDQSGTWHRRDDSLVPDPGGGFRRAAGPEEIHFSARAEGELLRVSDDNWSIGMRSPDVASGALGDPSGRAVTYRGIAPGIDLRYTIQGSQIKEEVVLQRSPGPDDDGLAAGQTRFHLNLANVTPRSEPDGTIAFTDSSGSVVARIPQGVAYDALAVGDPVAESLDLGGMDALKVPVTSTLVPLQDGGWAVDTYVDRAWLVSPRRSYPVVIDPTLVLGRDTSMYDYTVRSSNGEVSVEDGQAENAASADSGTYRIDYPDGDFCDHPYDYRSSTYAHFDLGILEGRTIDSATLHANITNGTADISVAAAGQSEGRVTTNVSPGWANFDATTWLRRWTSRSPFCQADVRRPR